MSKMHEKWNGIYFCRWTEYEAVDVAGANVVVVDVVMGIRRFVVFCIFDHGER